MANKTNSKATETTISIETFPGHPHMVSASHNSDLARVAACIGALVFVMVSFREGPLELYVVSEQRSCRGLELSLGYVRDVNDGDLRKQLRNAWNLGMMLCA